MELKEKELTRIESKALESIRLLWLVNELVEAQNAITDCYCSGSCAGGCTGTSSGA